MSKYFGKNNEEFRCHGTNPDGSVHDCGLNVIDPKLVDICDEVRKALGVPLVIASGSRCPIHNEDVGGAPHSAHLKGQDGKSHAVDIRCNNDILRARIREEFAWRGIDRFEVSNKHLHVDNAWYLPHPILAAVVFKGAVSET
jgi:hypothetical protein